jgi:hypothetical protein
MEPARKYQLGEAEGGAQKDQGFESEERVVPEWEIKLGKIIFYITCALSLWFFYWLNGIQCPC